MPIEYAPAASYRCFEGRSDGWTPEAECKFLRTIAEGGNVSNAARAVGMSLSAAYSRRHDSRRRGFAIAWEAALVLAKDRLIDNLFERAIDGERFTTVKDGGETIYERPNYRLGLGFLKHLEEKQPGREAQWVASHFDEWLESLACNTDHALRDMIEPYQNEDPWLRLWARKTFPLVEDSAKNEEPDADDPNPVWHAGGRWLTRFPPPADFDGEVIEGEPGDPLYCRTLSTEEAAIMRQSEDTLESDQRKEDADALEQACAQRDAWFANMRDDPRGERGQEHDEHDWYAYEQDEPPIEYKSIDGPLAADSDELLVHAETRRRGGRLPKPLRPPQPSLLPLREQNYFHAEGAEVAEGSSRSCQTPSASPRLRVNPLLTDGAARLPARLISL